MNKNELIAAVADSTGLAKNQAGAALDAVLSAISAEDRKSVV